MRDVFPGTESKATLDSFLGLITKRKMENFYKLIICVMISTQKPQDETEDRMVQSLFGLNFLKKKKEKRYLSMITEHRVKHCKTYFIEFDLVARYNCVILHFA